MLARRVPARTCRAPAVRLDAPPAAADAESDAPRWIQVAYEGAFLGHWQGPFEFTRATFETLIKNFRAHPSFRAGADGWGVADVIRFDFDHVSERDPTLGDVPVVGAPAQAWALDLDVRAGADGTAELWALTRYLEPARTYVREGRYKWTSVSVLFNGTDPVTGEDVGPTLTSIAFTNDPFLQGMVPITAHGGGWCDAPKTVGDVLLRLRCIFALPETADLGQLMGELGKLRAWTVPGAAPPVGVDVAALCAELRALFNLPTLSASDAIFAEADKLLARLAEEQAASAAGACRRRRRPRAHRLHHSTRRPDMGELDLKNLARRLKVKDTEEAVLLAIDQASGAEQMLTSLLEALGVDDPQGAVTRIAGLLKQAADLEKAMPELAALKDRVAQVDEKDANEEVDQAMATHGMPPSARVALLNLRRSDAKAFREAYPVPPADRAHLTQSVFTMPGARAAAAPPATSSALSRLQAGPNGVVRAPLAPPPGLAAGDASVNLAGYAGANAVQRAMSYVRAQPGGDKLTFDEAHERGCELVRTLRAAGRPT